MGVRPVLSKAVPKSAEMKCQRYLGQGGMQHMSKRPAEWMQRGCMGGRLVMLSKDGSQRSHGLFSCSFRRLLNKLEAGAEGAVGSSRR
mgnify:CR=1 FL=1